MDEKDVRGKLVLQWWWMRPKERNLDWQQVRREFELLFGEPPTHCYHFSEKEVLVGPVPAVRGQE